MFFSRELRANVSKPLPPLAETRKAISSCSALSAALAPVHSDLARVEAAVRQRRLALGLSVWCNGIHKGGGVGTLRGLRSLGFLGVGLRGVGMLRAVKGGG